MLDYQTILIYLLLFTIMVSLAYQARKTNLWFPIIIAVLIYSVVFGMRYNVGVDYMSYWEDYNYASISSDNINTHYERGFNFIIMTLVRNQAHFSYFFGIIAFLQLYLVLRSVKEEPEVYPYLIFTFMFGCIWLTYANGLRQQLAFCFFALSILFIEKNKWLLYYITIAICISMHSSATLLVIIYPLLKFKEKWFENVNLQLLLLFVAIILGNINTIQRYLGVLETYASFLGYERYFLDKYEDLMYKPIEHKGVGYYVILLLNIVTVWYSTEFKDYFGRKQVYYIYNLYFVGLLLKYAFIGSLLLQRINYYFYGFSYIVGAFAILYAKDNNRRMYWALVVLYTLIFIATMFRMVDNTAFFRFYWQISD